jgi:glycolate oxidase FAD binding subunit
MSASSAAATLARDLAAIVGREHVSHDPAALQRFAIDGVQPPVAASPGSAEEVAAVVHFAYQRDLVVAPAGGFTRQCTGRVPERVDVVLQTARLNRIEQYDAGDLTISAGAGATLAELEGVVAPHCQWLPLDVPGAQRATIGGVLATAAHGPLKHAYGGVREFCVGIRFVTGDGKLAKAGGRVVKNVAGYDLMKLLIGSYGTLGVIVGASFKLFPRPQQTRTFICDFPLQKEALKFRDVVMRSPLAPLALEVASPLAECYLSGSSKPGPWRVLLRAGGSEAVLARYGRELGQAASRQLSGEEEAGLWRAVAQFEESLAARHRNLMTVHVSVPAASVGCALKAAEGAALDNNFLVAVLGRFAAGALLVAFIPVGDGPPAVMQYAQAASALRAKLPRDASAVVARCPLEAKAHFDVWGTSPNDMESMCRIGEALDPNEILNRGRFLL